jgi:hypothetical protein
VRRHPGVALGVGPLADHREVGVELVESSEQTVDITTDAPAVGGDGCRIDQHSGGHERLPPRLTKRLA